MPNLVKCYTRINSYPDLYDDAFPHNHIFELKDPKLIRVDDIRKIDITNPIIIEDWDQKLKYYKTETFNKKFNTTMLGILVELFVLEILFTILTSRISDDEASTNYVRVSLTIFSTLANLGFYILLFYIIPYAKMNEVVYIEERIINQIKQFKVKKEE